MSLVGTTALAKFYLVCRALCLQRDQWVTVNRTLRPAKINCETVRPNPAWDSNPDSSDLEDRRHFQLGERGEQIGRLGIEPSASRL